MDGARSDLTARPTGYFGRNSDLRTRSLEDKIRYIHASTDRPEQDPNCLYIIVNSRLCPASISMRRIRPCCCKRKEVPADSGHRKLSRITDFGPPQAAVSGCGRARPQALLPTPVPVLAHRRASPPRCGPHQYVHALSQRPAACEQHPRRPSGARPRALGKEIQIHAVGVDEQLGFQVRRLGREAIDHRRGGHRYAVGQFIPGSRRTMKSLGPRAAPRRSRMRRCAAMCWLPRSR